MTSSIETSPMAAATFRHDPTGGVHKPDAEIGDHDDAEMHRIDPQLLRNRDTGSG